MKSFAIATTTTLAISAFSGLSISSLSQSALANDCPRFYKGRDLAGASFQLCLTNSNTIPAGFNDQISSLIILQGHKCILYTDAAFKGQRIEFIGPTGVVNLQRGFDNKVSSIQCTTDHLHR